MTRCPNCDSEDWEVLDSNLFIALQCLNCGHVWIEETKVHEPIDISSQKKNSERIKNG